MRCSRASTEMELEVESNQDREVVQWDKILPRTALTVLLVEADFSTRHILTALLRKCSYKVIAVPDGLMAWETLKDGRNQIDLILSELELPSISGFALLTLVVEHDTLKNIPVIMMSTHDEISMVLKCMLKGAVDFLVKPIRKNELRNIWQHVWRRNTVNSVCQDLHASQSKVDGVVGEKCTAINNPVDLATSKQKNKACSDVQSSCTTSYMEAESVVLQNMQGLSQVTHRSADLSDNILVNNVQDVQQAEDSPILGLGSKGSLDENARHVDDDGKANTSGGHSSNDKVYRALDLIGRKANTSAGHSSNGKVYEAMDLIGGIDNRLCFHNDAMDNLNLAPQLELSLRPISSRNQEENEKQMFNRPNASAFSNYNSSNSWQKVFPAVASNAIELKEGGSKAHDLVQLPKSKNQEYITLPSIGQTGEGEVTQLSLLSALGLTLNSLSENREPHPELLPTHSWSTSTTTCQKEDSPFPVITALNSQSGRQSEESVDCSTDQTFHEQNDKDSKHDSPAADRSTCTSLCNTTTAADTLSNEVVFPCDGYKGMDSHGISLREAALTKFRLKRKERCFEKKVRYESRKKLAEKRPRVKGQFVRQGPNDALAADC